MKFLLRIKLWVNRKLASKIGRGVFKTLGKSKEDMVIAVREDETLIPRAERLYTLAVDRANIFLRLGWLRDYKLAGVTLKVMNDHIYNLKQAASA